MTSIDATSQSSRRPAIVILDFGSQYSELIARRVRETEVFSLVPTPPRLRSCASWPPGA